MSAIEGCCCAADCDKVLQAWPSFKGMQVGKEMQERIKTGKINENRVVKIEDDWHRRLECLDDAHSKVKGLCIREAEMLVNKLTEYVDCAPAPACPDQKASVLRCYQKHKGDTLSCADEVDAFTDCVDDMLRNCGCRQIMQSAARKTTYKEQFNRYLLDCPEDYQI